MNAHPRRSPRLNRFTRRLVFETLDARRCLASVVGTVFHDANLDGTQASTEVGLAERVVTADIDGDGVIGPSEPNAVTGRDGSFVISGLDSTTIDLFVTPVRGWVSNHTFRGAITVDLSSGDAVDVPVAQATVFDTFAEVAARGAKFLLDSLHPTSGLPRNEATIEDLSGGTFRPDGFFVPAQLGHILSVIAGAHAASQIHPDFLAGINPTLFNIALIGQLDKTFASLQTMLSNHAFDTGNGKLLYQVHRTADGVPPLVSEFDRTVSLLDNVQLIVGLQEITNQLARVSGPGLAGTQFARVRDDGLDLISQFDLGAFYDRDQDRQQIRITRNINNDTVFDRITSETRQAPLAMLALSEISELEFRSTLGFAIQQSSPQLPGGPKHLPFKGGALEIWVPTPHASGELNTSYGAETLIALGNAWDNTLKNILPELPAIGAMPIATQLNGFQELVLTPGENGQAFQQDASLLIGPAAGIMAGTLAASAGQMENSAANFAIQNLASTVAAYNKADEYHGDYGMSNCLDLGSGLCDSDQDLRGTNEIGMMTEGLLNQLLGGSFYTDLLADTPQWAEALSRYYELLNVSVVGSVEAEDSGSPNSSRGNASGGQTRKLETIGDSVGRQIEIPETGRYGIRVPYSHHDTEQTDALSIFVDDVPQPGIISLANTLSWNVITHSDIIPIGNRDPGMIDVAVQLDAIGNQPVEIDRIELVRIPKSIDQQPVVNIFASLDDAAEGGGSTTFVVHRSGPTADDLTVQLDISGTATGGSDYTPIPSTVTIPAGSGSVRVQVSPIVDALAEGTEVVEAHLNDSADYLVGPTSAAVAAIIDAQDEPKVEFTSTSQVIVTQAASFTISVTLDGPSETAIAIPFAVSGTATAGVDFIIPESPLIVSAESTSADIVVTLLQAQSGETIVLTLGDPDGATLGSNDVHTATVNTPPTITDISDQSVVVNTATQAIPFTIADIETDLDSMNVTASSSDQTLVPDANLTIAGTGADRTITMTPAMARIGTATITVTVTDAGGLSDTDTIVLTVTPRVADPVVNISPNGPGGAADPDPLPGTDETPTTWASQRSSVRQIVIDLGAPISNAAANDIVLTNLGIDAPVDIDVIVPISDSQLSLSADGLHLTVNFTADQLTDGVYQLDLLPSISGGATFTTVGNASNKFYVLAGDWNGSGGVNIQDFATFAYWFGISVPTAPAYVDSNHSGGINIQDFAGFAANFGKSVTFPGVVTGLKALGAGEGELDALAAAFQNPSDVNGDGRLTARDALNVINAVERDGSTDDPARSRFDANRDGRVSNRDALYVVNRLADQPRGWQLALADPNEDHETYSAIDQLLSDEVFARGLF